MTYRPPTQSARARGDAELAVELGVTTQTLRAYIQDNQGMSSGQLAQMLEGV